MRFVVVMLNVMPLYLMNYELNEWMTNKVDCKLVKVLFKQHALLVRIRCIVTFRVRQIRFCNLGKVLLN